ncbi:MAG: hypothetical protein PVG79_12780 [Gemmatimonadales bacterium]
MQQEHAVFSESPRAVIETLSAVLVERGELAAAAAREVGESAVAAFESDSAAELSSESRELARAELESLVREDARRFVGDGGGRYVVSIAIEAADGGTRVTVTPTLVAYVPGMEDPLGGRPLPSNGTLERAILAAVGERLR